MKKKKKFESAEEKVVEPIEEKVVEPIQDEVFALSAIIPKVKGLKLQIASGSNRLDGFINVDRYNPLAEAPWDAGDLKLNNDTVALIVSSETLEHFGYHELLPIFKEWYRVLVSGGEVHIVTVDIISSCKLIVEKPDEMYPMARLFGSQCHDGQFHKWGFTPKMLNDLTLMTGFAQSRCGYADSKDGAQYIYFVAIK
jgi:predicted SAM-dependent methyltransferase